MSSASVSINFERSDVIHCQNELSVVCCLLFLTKVENFSNFDKSSHMSANQFVARQLELANESVHGGGSKASCICL